MARLHLDPPGPPPAGLVRRRRRLDHDAFVPARDGIFEERRRRGDVVGHDARDPAPGGTTPASAASRSAPGRSRRSRPSRCSTSKKNGVNARPSPAGRFAGRRTARGVLEPPGPAVVLQRDRLAVEDHRVHGERAHGLDHSGTRSVISSSVRVKHAHVVAVAVHLHADAVDLPLDHARRRASRSPPRRRLRSARASAGRDGRPRARSAASPSSPSRERHLRRCSGDRRRASPPAGRPHLDAGGAGDRVGHDARRRPLAQLAADEHDEEALLLGRGPPEQPVEQRPPSSDRPGTVTPAPPARTRRRCRTSCSDGVDAGCGRSRSDAHPTPVRRWRNEPER